jgi:cytochrome c2
MDQRGILLRIAIVRQMASVLEGAAEVATEAAAEAAAEAATERPQRAPRKCSMCYSIKHNTRTYPRRQVTS